MIKNNSMQINPSLGQKNKDSTFTNNLKKGFFISPLNFREIISNRSMIIFGGHGSGKTTLYQHFIDHDGPGDNYPRYLIVEWHFSPLQTNQLTGIAAVGEQIRQIFGGCAESLFTYLTRYPNCFEELSPVNKKRVIWFLHSFILDDLSLQAEFLLEEHPQANEVLQTIINAPIQNVLSLPAPEQRIMRTLVGMIQALGFEGIWVIVDGLEVWAKADSKMLINNLNNFFSALPLFEDQQFCYKLFAPTGLEPFFLKARGLASWRVTTCRLSWEQSTLVQLVEQHLSSATGQPNFGLANLCRSEKLLPWLERIGGDSPREWLDQIKPLLSYYLDKNLQTPVDEKTWRRLRRNHPPRLHINPDKQQIIVGARQISLDKLPIKYFKILCYLYQHNDEIVSRSKLYYLIYRGLETSPRVATDKYYEAPKEYEGIMSNAVYKLRKAIEPDPKHPTLLITKRGYGLKLQVRW
ncbi:winged helix-turn-helix domain-containing protein [Anaerolineales bacterium HSG6]|nr:winged helix-turn-helix domain-containing protein [Anaerolineales bacterium HSG6]